MAHTQQLACYLKRKMENLSVSASRLADRLPNTSANDVQSWLNGWELPPRHQVPYIALALGVDPFELMLGWMIEDNPALEELVFREALRPRGSDFPHSSDSSLRAARPRPISCSMDIEDPHDTARAPTSTVESISTLIKSSRAISV
jgi:hypothetical protein